MTHEEFIILEFMKQFPGTALSRKEIARKANRRSEYEANQHWADQPLAALVATGAIEINDSGHYCLPERRW
jgi:hypothetical protein